jgi:UDP-3-O-[3-hydroxymyristoyl] N-acetylglucosamine deacetylase
MQDTTSETVAGTLRADTGSETGCQRTLRHAISCVGVGRHSGLRVGLTLHPAAPASGVRFRRSDRPGSVALVAQPRHLVVAEHALILADDDGTRIVGVEHVLAALAMTGIDNALIEVGGPELPAMDGSAQPFVFLIECAGVVEQDAARIACPPPATVDLRRADCAARLASTATPCLVTDIAGEAVAGFGPDQHSVALSREALCAELAAARHPLTMQAFEAARERGLMRGASLDNTLILAATGAVNRGGLRFVDEPARHANLLALGALYLLGGLPAVELRTRRAGHALLATLLRQCAGVTPAGETRPDGLPVGQLAGAPA